LELVASRKDEDVGTLHLQDLAMGRVFHRWAFPNQTVAYQLNSQMGWELDSERKRVLLGVRVVPRTVQGELEDL
jgi:hypothetical protein